VSSVIESFHPFREWVGKNAGGPHVVQLGIGSPGSGSPVGLGRLCCLNKPRSGDDGGGRTFGVHGEHLRPVDYLVIEYSAASTLRDGFDHLLGLVDPGLIRVLDQEFVADTVGTVRTIAASEVAAELAAF
jgi:hypothetical protein